MNLYYVTYISEDGTENEKTFKCASPGQAFRQFMRKKPGIRPIKCYVSGCLAGQLHFPRVSVTYTLPKGEHITPAVPHEKIQQLEFQW